MHGDAREDREWENWPGRKPPDDRIRHRLKSLFSATDDPDAVDALITDRGREIEEQTERLQLTIENLEQREEQAARLRAAVEEMLRHGSAELDERHAALTARHERKSCASRKRRLACAGRSSARSSFAERPSSGERKRQRGARKHWRNARKKQRVA